MVSMSSVQKKHLHELVDALPDNEVPAAQRYLEFLRQQGEDPVRAALDAAPIDDEPETEDEARAVAEARGGKVVSHAEAKRRLGL